MIKKLIQNYDLSSLNTFGVSAQCDYFSSFKSMEELINILHEAKKLNLKILCLGGGSNILFIKKFDGLVIHNEISEFDVLSEDSQGVKVKVGAGVKWDDFVRHSLQQKWYGLENLSLIPGTVGAAPIQNIGAYGVEVKEFIEEVETLNPQNLNIKVFKNNECDFKYRWSRFKHEDSKKLIITSVVFKLSKELKIKSTYKALNDFLIKNSIKDPSPNEIAQAVIKIRQSKLPDPKILGNAGSFFKNPIVSNAIYENLKIKYPHLVGYPENQNETKIPAGWLIENSGLKGFVKGKCGVHKDQALVLVNFGGAEGIEILELAQMVQKKVQDQFSVVLEFEVNIH